MNPTRPLPSLDALVAFESAARHRSFTAAARELHVTQSAVSHRIRGLEDQLGSRLFTRTTREIQLTETGALLLGVVASSLDTLRKGLAAVFSPRDELRLTVSCSLSFAMRWLMPRLHEFREAYPELQVRWVTDDRTAALPSDGIDVAIGFGSGPYPGFSVVRLSVEHVFPVCSPALARSRGLRAPADLVRVPLLHHEALGDHPDRIDWSGWLAKARVRGVDAEKGPRFSHAHMALEAAVAGQGVALGRTTLVTSDLLQRRLVVPFGPRLRSKLTYSLVIDPNAVDRSAVVAFRSWITSAMGARSSRSGRPTSGA